MILHCCGCGKPLHVNQTIKKILNEPYHVWCTGKKWFNKDGTRVGDERRRNGPRSWRFRF